MTLLKLAAIFLVCFAIAEIQASPLRTHEEDYFNWEQINVIRPGLIKVLFKKL